MVVETSLRVLHIADVHNNSKYMDTLFDLVKTKQQSEVTKIHAITSPGDFIDISHKSEDGTLIKSINKHISPETFKEELKKEEHQKVFLNYQKEIYDLEKAHNITEESKPQDIDPSVIDQIKKVLIERQSYIEETHYQVINQALQSKKYTIDNILTDIKSDYQTISDQFQKIKDLGVEILAVAGNHDTKQVYNLDSDKGGPITFVDHENREKVKLTGYDGTEFIIQGDINSFEIPKLVNKLIIPAITYNKGKKIELEDVLIDYSSGFCLNKENESNTTRTPFSNLVDPSDPEKLAEVQKYQAEARKRLGKPDQADIYLTHKITKYGDLGTGDIAAEYSKNSTTVLAGHKHAIQIGDIEGEQQLDEILMRSNLEEEIDGYKIKVIEMDGNEPLQLNAGSNFALEVVYNSNKEWEEVVIYQLQER